jgi:hypothetical protein
VIVPFRKWRKLNEDYQKLQNKLQVFNDIQEGFSEVKRARNRSEASTAQRLPE